MLMDAYPVHLTQYLYNLQRFLILQPNFQIENLISEADRKPLSSCHLIFLEFSIIHKRMESEKDQETYFHAFLINPNAYCISDSVITRGGANLIVCFCVGFAIIPFRNNAFEKS